MFFSAQGKGEPFMTWGVGKLVCKLTRGSARPPEGPRDAFSAFYRQEEGLSPPFFFPFTFFFFFLFPFSLFFFFYFLSFFPFPSGVSRPLPTAPAAGCPSGAEGRRARIASFPGLRGGPSAVQRGELPLPPRRACRPGVPVCDCEAHWSRAPDKALRGCGAAAGPRARLLGRKGAEWQGPAGPWEEKRCWQSLC